MMLIIKCILPLVLEADLKQNTVSVVCQLYIPDLGLLGQNYDLLMQIQYK